MITLSINSLLQKADSEFTTAEKNYIRQLPVVNNPALKKSRLIVSPDYCKTEKEVISVLEGMGIVNPIYFMKRHPTFTEGGKFSRQNLIKWLIDYNFLTGRQTAPGVKEILQAAYSAMCAGVFPIKCSRQLEILGYTPIRYSTSFSKKMKGKSAFSTCNLVNPLCLMKMNNPEFICSECYAEETANLHIESALNWLQNFFFEVRADLPDILIPVLNRGRRDCYFKRYGNGIRIEAYGDTASPQHQLFYDKLCAKNPDWLFTQWTKNPGYAVKSFEKYGKPKNLKLGLSGYKTNVFPIEMYEKFIPTGHFDFVFVVTDSKLTRLNWLKELPAAYPCMCEDESCAKLCGRCYGESTGSTEIIVEMLRPQKKRRQKNKV